MALRIALLVGFVLFAAIPAAAVSDSLTPTRDVEYYGWWHDTGELLLHVSNLGFTGNFGFGSGEPSAEWPPGSGYEHVYVAGLWFGAQVDGIPHVSTSAWALEFAPPGDDPVYTIHTGAFDMAGGLRFIDDDGDGLKDEDRLDGFDNDLDGAIDEDYGGISEQMFVRTYFDTAATMSPPPHEHIPLGIRVTEESYAWSADDRDDFVGVHYEFTNVSTDTWEDVFIGVIVDPDVGYEDSDAHWEDDVSFVADEVVMPGLDGLFPPVRVMAAYAYDEAGGADGDWNGHFGAVLLNHSTPQTGSEEPRSVEPLGYGIWSPSGVPAIDSERYAAMQGASIPDTPLPPGDTRFLLVTGPYGTLAPGETVELDIAFVCGEGLDGFLENAATAVTVYNGYYSKGLGQQVRWRVRDEITPLWQNAYPGPWRSGRGKADTPVFEPALTVGQMTAEGAVHLALSLPQPASATVSIYDVSGRLVATLARGALPAGAHALDWSGRTDDGDQAASGVYFVRALVDSEVLSAKLALVR